MDQVVEKGGNMRVLRGNGGPVIEGSFIGGSQGGTECAEDVGKITFLLGAEFTGAV